jgi:hypothetical protein
MDEIEKTEVLVEETDRACHPVQRVLDLLAGKQRAHDAEVFAEIADLHRVHAHHAHGGVASADAEKDAARSDPVDRRNRVSGYRRDARAGDGHAGAEFDALGIVRCEREGGVAIRPDHLRVGDPGAVVAEILGVLDQLPVVDPGGDEDAELHL